MGEAIDPLLRQIQEAARRVGWSLAEIQTAVLNWSITAMVYTAAEINTPEAWAGVLEISEQVKELTDLQIAHARGVLPTIPPWSA